MKKIIKFEMVSFCYLIKPILKNVNLTIDEGDFIGIIGPNGGGKTTFLKLLMGMLTPHIGRIEVFNKNPKEVRDKIGYVPQSYNIDKTFPITTFEVVLLGMLTRSKFGFFSKKQKEEAKDLLDAIGLKNFIYKPFGKLSGGQIQRALIARALISDPELLILDEPIANIDQESQKNILNLLINSEKKRTILMVSHDVNTIINDVKKIITIQCEVNSLVPKKVCEHFALGLYHNPIIGNNK